MGHPAADGVCMYYICMYSIEQRKSARMERVVFGLNFKASRDSILLADYLSIPSALAFAILPNLSSLGKTNRKTKTKILQTSIILPPLTSAPFIYLLNRLCNRYMLSVLYYTYVLCSLVVVHSTRYVGT